MIKHHNDIVQGTEEWHDIRCGLLTASEMKLIITPTLKIAANDKTRAHMYELAAQRVTKYVEPSYIGDDMLRGWEDEIRARNKYAENLAPVDECGFITNDKWGFTIGYSPDGLIGDKGLIEIKSRRQKLQMETILSGNVPDEHIIQVQTALLVSEREYIDYISYCGGMPMFIMRVYPDSEIQEAIINAATDFETKVADMITKYDQITVGMMPTEREVEKEITI